MVAERLEQELRVVRQRFGDDVQNHFLNFLNVFSFLTIVTIDFDFFFDKNVQIVFLEKSCQRKAAGKPQVPKSPRGPGPKP